MRENSTKSWKDRGFDFINNIYAGIALMVLCVVASILYSRFGPVWSRPIMNGLITGAVVLSLFLSVRAVLSLPSATVKITPENVGEKVLTWLHRFNLTVKTFPEDSECHFFIVATTDAGKKVGVFRKKGHLSDYLSFQSSVTQTDETREAVELLSEEEKIRLLLDLQMELARAVIGYTSSNMLESYTLFKRIPITETLSEGRVIDAIWEMESMVARSNLVERMGSFRHHLAIKARKH